MERRDFLKLASAAGLGVVAGGAFIGEGKADDVYKGPFYLGFNAGGGWNPSSFCDPKGGNGPMDPNRNDNYLTSEIHTTPNGKIKCAPSPADMQMNGDYALTNQAFFDKYQDLLLVVNGVDMATNNHDSGNRCAWSGTLQENKAAFNALVVGVYAPTQPMAFITNGGYDASAGVVAVSRVGNLNALQRIAYPGVIDPNNPDSQMYHAQNALDILQKTRDERLKALQAKQQLPRINARMGMLFMARTGQNQLKALTAFLPENLEGGLQGQAQIAIAAMRAGVCVAAQLSIGGFDTHGNHDNQHYPQLAELWGGVDYAWTEAQKTQELAGNLRIMCAFDFGRIYGYNDGNGKDHWSISSMMFMGAGIPGGKVVGGTTDKLDPLTVDANGNLSESGFRITPGHVHKALRKLAGIDTNPIVAKFPLSAVEDLNLFG